MSEGIQHQIWRVRGRPGRPLRRGRSRSRASRPTAIRTASVPVGSPAMVLYLSCRKWYRAHQWNSSASLDLARGVGLNPRYWIAFRRRHERRDPQPFSGSTGAHCRWSRMAGDRCHQRTVRCRVRVIHGFLSCHRVAQASMSGQIWYSKSARGDSTRSLRSAIVCNSSMIAGTYSRTRRRTWLRKSARDQGTRAPHGRRRVRSARSRDRSPAPEHDPPSIACWCPIRACPNGSCVGAHRVCLVRVFGSVSSGLSFRRACRRLVDGPSCGAALGARLVTSLSLLKQSGEVKKREQRHREMSEGIQRPSVRSGVSEDAQGGPCGGDDRAHAQAD